MKKVDFDWIEEVVDNHKMIRAESTRARVKILMMAALMRGEGNKKI